MPRYKLTLEYLGTNYAGWQRVPDRPSIQGALEDAAYGFCGHRVEVTGAGRTDAGVHATAQVAHVDLPRAFPPYSVMQGFNAHLAGHPIAITQAEEVGDDFHARFSATGRAYLYRILNRRARPAVQHGRVWHVPRPLDAKAMHDAAQALIGHHDFTSFRDSQCQAKSPMKTLDALDVERQGDEIHLHVRARSFLHHQVRILTGTLWLVGLHQATQQDVSAMLAAKNRSSAGPTAPPEGLYLVNVEY